MTNPESTSPPAASSDAAPVAGPARRVFDTGHWGRAREMARAALAGPDAALQQDARDVLARLRPDPAAVVVAVGAWLVLGAVVITALTG